MPEKKTFYSILVNMDVIFIRIFLVYLSTVVYHEKNWSGESYSYLRNLWGFVKALNFAFLTLMALAMSLSQGRDPPHHSMRL